MSILRSFRGIFDRSRNDADIQEEFAFRIEAEFGKRLSECQKQKPVEFD